MSILIKKLLLCNHWWKVHYFLTVCSSVRHSLVHSSCCWRWRATQIWCFLQGVSEREQGRPAYTKGCEQIWSSTARRFHLWHLLWGRSKILFLHSLHFIDISGLTPKVPFKIVADIIKYFFYCSETIRLEISWESSADDSHEIPSLIFFFQKKKWLKWCLLLFC